MRWVLATWVLLAILASPSIAKDPLRFYPPCQVHEAGYWQPVLEYDEHDELRRGPNGGIMVWLALTNRDINPRIDPGATRCWVLPGQYLIVMPQPRFAEPRYGSQRRSYEHLQLGLSGLGGDHSHR